MSTQTQQLGEQYREDVAGATAVTKYVRMIIAQEDISSIDGLPNLPTYQSAAKEQSNKWLEDIWPLIIKTTTDIIDYANTFQSGYDGLVDLVPQLEAGDEAAKVKANTIIEDIFLANLRKQLESSSSIADAVSTFHDSFQVLYEEFKGEFNKIDEKIRADDDKVDELTTEKNSYQTTAAIREHAAILAGIALPGIALTSYALSETGVGLIAGAIILAGDLIALGVLLGEYAEAMKHVYDLQDQIAALNTELTQLHAVETQISGLQDNSKKVKIASRSVADGWSSLVTYMENLIKDVDKITPAQTVNTILKELGVANQDWGVVLQQAKNLQPNGGQLEVTNYATYGDMLKALDKQAGGA